MGMFRGIQRAGLDYSSTGYSMDMAIAAKADALTAHSALRRRNGHAQDHDLEIRKLIADARNEYGSAKYHLGRLAQNGQSDEIKTAALKEIARIDRLERRLGSA